MQLSGVRFTGPAALRLISFLMTFKGIKFFDELERHHKREAIRSQKEEEEEKKKSSGLNIKSM